MTKDSELLFLMEAHTEEYGARGSRLDSPPDFLRWLELEHDDIDVNYSSGVEGPMVKI